MKKVFSILMCLVSLLFCALSLIYAKDIILLTVLISLGFVCFLAHVNLLINKNY